MLSGMKALRNGGIFLTAIVLLSFLGISQNKPLLAQDVAQESMLDLKNFKPVADAKTDSVGAFTDALAACRKSCSLVIPPGTYALSRGIVIENKSHIDLHAVGVTLLYTGADTNARLLEIRSSNYVSVYGLTLRSAHPHTGTAVSLRRPHDADPGQTTQYNSLRNVEIFGFNVGLEMGVAGEGQVDQGLFSYVGIHDCNTGVKQDNPQTEVVRYDHVVITAGPTNAVYFDMRSGSADLIEPVTGAGGLNSENVVHLRLGGTLRNVSLFNPHFEVGTEKGSVAIQWLASSAQVNVYGGVFSKYMTEAGTMMDLSASGTGGMISFYNTVVWSRGPASINFGPENHTFFSRNTYIGWTNISFDGITAASSSRIGPVFAGTGNANDVRIFGQVQGQNPHFDAVGRDKDVGLDFNVQGAGNLNFNGLARFAKPAVLPQGTPAGAVARVPADRFGRTQTISMCA